VLGVDIYCAQIKRDFLTQDLRNCLLRTCTTTRKCLQLLRFLKTIMFGEVVLVVDIYCVNYSAHF